VIDHVIKVTELPILRQMEWSGNGYTRLLGLKNRPDAVLSSSAYE